MPPEEIYRINGNQRGLFNTLPQLHAMRQEGEGWLLDNCRYALFVSDLFAWLLTGEAVTEYTTASVTQLFDFRTMDWSDVILERYGIRRSLFAPLVRPGERIGRTTEAVNRSLGTTGFPVTAVCHHDTGSAFLGAVGGPDSAIISAGTWSVVGTETAEPVITEAGFRHNIANEGSCPGHHRILKNTMGTWILQEIARELRERGEEHDFAALDARAEACEGSFLVDVDDPRFYSPGGMIEKVRAHCRENGLPVPESPGELVCAVQTGLAMRYRAAIEELEAVTGKRLTTIDLVGGGSQSRLACRLTADICGRTVLAGPVDATALGNVLVQLMAVGGISSIEEGRELIRRNFTIQRIEPGRGAAVREQQYREFREQFH